MRELNGDLRRAMAMHVVDDPLPGGRVLGFVHASAAQRDAALGRDIGHLGEDDTGTAHRAAAEVNEMEIIHCAVFGLIHAHRRHADPVFQRQPAQRERHEHRWRRGLVGADDRFGEFAIHLADERGRPLLEVAMIDAQRAGERIEGEPRRRKIGITMQIFQPVHFRFRRACGACRYRAPAFLVALQRRLDAAVLTICGSERQGVIERQLGPIEERRMRGLGAAAKQDAIAGTPSPRHCRSERREAPAKFGPGAVEGTRESLRDEGQ
jgi:hypothetical protein